MSDHVFVRTRKGRIHRAAVVNDLVLTPEACNLDDAVGENEVLTQVPEGADEAAFCKRCFPPEGADA